MISQDREDINLFTKVLEPYHSYYNEYPKNVCADDGYGSLENYKFLSQNNIDNYVKYFNWEGNDSCKNP